MNAEDIIALNEEIAGMARAGLPLDQGLAALAREMGRGRLRRVTEALAADLRAGHPLPEALDRQAGRVPAFYRGLVAAGIRTGRIGEVLVTMSTYTRAIANLRSTVVEALFYPCVVLTLGVFLFGLVCFFILPQFAQVYKEFNIRLPAATEFALKLSRHPVEFIAVPAVMICLIVVMAYLGTHFSAAGRRLWAGFLYSIPVAGTLVRAARLAAFTDLLAILVDHSIPLPEAFRLAGEASSDPIMARESREIQEHLSQGKSLGEVLRGRGLVPEWVAWMAGVGEQRGALGKTLHQVAEMYRRQVELRAALLRSVLPPFFIIALAVLFGGLFLTIGIIPMVRLLEGLSK